MYTAMEMVVDFNAMMKLLPDFYQKAGLLMLLSHIYLVKGFTK